MEATYSNSWIEYIKSCVSTGKLIAYSKFKNSFQLENYLLQFPVHMRRNLTKLRISAHNLAIETSRYRSKSQIVIPISKRLCFHCNDIETEHHLLFDCPLYNVERDAMWKEIAVISTIEPSCADRFNIFMSCMNGDAEIGKIVCKHINACFAKRSEVLCQIKETEALLRPKTTITRSGRTSTRPIRYDV